jgi:hypothetical protein
MKQSITITLFLAFGIFSSIAQPNKKVQVAILFDTSNSMDGLIDQAKSRIWNIVNEVSELTYNGRTPQLEFALYHYGNDRLSSSSNYIEQILPFSSDLDVLSSKLFALSTNGGSEFCGAVIGKSLKDLNWSNDPTDLKMIYIAGNERFDQGPVSYKEVCAEAVKKGIFINTIYCGDYNTGVRELWKDGATCSSGDFLKIDADKAIVHIDTPYDKKINQYNDSLNKTYYGYGKVGAAKKMSQVAEDSNAEMESISVKTERSIVKSKGQVYNNSSWDLIDAAKSGTKIEELKEDELPDEFKNKTAEEKIKLVEQKKQEREKYQEEISNLAKERQKFIDEELKKRANEGDVDDFGTSVNESILNKAKEIGYQKTLK